MYVPAAFAEPDTERLRAFVEAEPFGMLVASGPDGATVSHLPFLLDGAEDTALTLHAHAAAANPQTALLEGATVLVVFQGPHGYVSPRWYGAEPAVPTWNYGAVHVRGRARTFREPARLEALVTRLADRFEAERDRPWTLAETPKRFREAMLSAIVGIEIAVTDIEGKMKLSQNRPPADRFAVAAALHSSDRGGDQDLARLMDRYNSIKQSRPS
ncbi:MAG: FMN-binding negative transcriptional regulator [Bauldia litoralis]